jgi:hypothetical protein
MESKREMIIPTLKTPKYLNKKKEKNERSDSNSKMPLLAGIMGMIGVVCGSMVTGFFSIKAQTITANQQKTILSRQLAANERQELRKTLSVYIDLVGEYFQLITSKKITAKELDTFAKKSFNCAAEISVLISLDLGVKTFELNKVFLGNLKAKSKNQYTEKMEDDVQKKFIEWMAVAKGELKVLEYTASPDNLSIDAIRLLLSSAAKK